MTNNYTLLGTKQISQGDDKVKKKQTYICNSKECQNKTSCTMPVVDWLQIEIIKCSKCDTLIAFSTLYYPKKFVRMTVTLP